MRNLRIAGVMAAGLVLAACGSSGKAGGTTSPTATSGGSTSSTTASPSASAEISGDITVLTQRTDLVDNVFKTYAAKFHAKYPKANVKFQGITDYEGEVRTRMNTTNYGDVLVIPNSVTADQLPKFFEPLGDVATMKKKYRFIDEQAYQGKAYGIAITGNAQGFVYNKAVWKAAGVTKDPTTPDEFIADLQAIKAKTKAIPLYTNYKDGWPLTQWEGARGGISADPNAVNALAHDPAPWAAGKEHNIIDTLLYNVVKDKLTEPDPTTTAWEGSKPLMGQGKIGTMMLGSWAIVQMQEKATNKADIGYLPFPVQKDGKFHSVIGGDYKQAINKNSKHKDVARAWIDWFADESHYATDQGGVSPLRTDPQPTTLADFKANNVVLLELTPAPVAEQGLLTRIDKAAEIGLFDPTYRQRIVDAARGAKKESLDSIFADLNKKWAASMAKTK